MPEAKIRQRHRRLWTPVAEAIAVSDLATVYDNSRLRGPRIVARLSGGLTVGAPELAHLGAGDAAGALAGLAAVHPDYQGSLRRPVST